MTGPPVYGAAVGPGLAVSFQRYRCPPSGLVERPTASCGALPVVADRPGVVLVPCPQGEALWIGLAAQGSARTVVAVHALGATVHLDVPPAHAAIGVPRGAPGGPVWAFARAADGPPPCARIDLTVTSGPVDTDLRVELVDPAVYTAATGRDLPPLDEGAAYGGWLLP